MKQTNPLKPPREEMWLITMAKSKIMRFFAVSCEFIIFLGCLWLTLVTVLPDATTWAAGAIDKFFLVAMGFAVDAALPEAWLHVVDQWTERKRSQLNWSVPIAIGMLLLVVANFVYSKLAGNGKPDASLEALVNTLLVARMFIGISYVTIRECQSFLDRKHLKQHPPVPVVSVVDSWALVGLAGYLQEENRQALSQMKTSLLSTWESRPQPLPEVDTQALTQAVASYLIPQFQARFQAVDEELFRQKRTISEVQLQAKKLPEKTSSGKDVQAKTPEFRQTPSGSVQAEKVIRLVPPNASREELIAEARRLQEVDGLSSYQIGERLGKSAKTVQSWLRSGKDVQAEEEVIEAAN